MRWRGHGWTNLSCRKLTYLVLPVREMFLYEYCGPHCRMHPPRYTKPEGLFDSLGETPDPSDIGLRYLFMAAPAPLVPSSSDSKASLHSLPLEIQGMILENMSPGWTHA